MKITRYFRTFHVQVLLLLFALTLCNSIPGFAQGDAAFKDMVNLQHLSDLYDARGFRQGSVPVNVDGKLNVSTANGTVSYSYPISERAIDGHNIRVELNYCGSVAFTSFKNYEYSTAVQRWWGFQVNKPAWVIGVGGFAVQMLSTTNQINEPWEQLHSEMNNNTGRDYNYARPKNWVVAGYDYCNRMIDFTNILPPKVTTDGTMQENVNPTDYIRLLRSDGSVMELVKQSKKAYPGDQRANTDTASSLYTGYYIVNQANSPGYAYVHYDTVDGYGITSYWQPHIWEQLLYMKVDTGIVRDPSIYNRLKGIMPRVVHYFPGNGLEYIFHEWITPYGMQAFTGRNAGFVPKPGTSDFDLFSLGGRNAGPTIFYLEEIRSASKTIARLRRSRHYPGVEKLDSTCGRAPLLAMSTSEGNSEDHFFHLHSNNMTIEALGKRTNITFTKYFPIDAREGQIQTLATDLAYLYQYNYNDFCGMTMVKEITDPAGRKTTFEYEKYTRQYENFGWPWKISDDNKPRVLDTSERLYTITEQDKKVKYHISYSSPLDTIMTKTPSNPSKIVPLEYPARFTTPQANKVEKYGFNGNTPVPLTTQKYEFQYMGTNPPDYSKVAECTVTTEDKRNGSRLLTDRYTFDYKKIGEPAVVYTGTRHTHTVQEIHSAGSQASMTNTSYSQYGPSEYVQLPRIQDSYVLGTGNTYLRQSLKRFGYQVGTVRTFGGDTALSNSFGQGVLRDTVTIYRGDDTNGVRLRTITDYLNLQMLRDTATRPRSTWDFLESRKRRDSLRLAGYMFGWDPVEWKIAIDKKDPRTALLRYDTMEFRTVLFPPHSSLPIRTVTYDSAGTLLGGKIMRYETTTSNIYCPRGSLICDTVIGRGGALLPGSSYRYEAYRNLMTAIRNPLGATSYSYYNYEIPELKITGTNDYDTAYGMAMTDLNMHRKKKLASGEFLYWYQEPAAQSSLVRYYSPQGDSIRARRLTQLYERSYYGLASAVVDENMNYSKFEYDPIGRLLWGWLPYDIPSDTVRVAWYNGWRTTPGDGYSYTLWTYGTTTCYPPPQQPTYGYEYVDTTDRSVLKAWLPPSYGVGGSSGCDPSKGQYTYRSSTLGEVHTIQVYLPMPKNVISIDSIYACFFVTAVKGQCTQVKFSVGGTNLTRTFVFNCPPPGNNYFHADSVPVNIPLVIDLASIKNLISAGANFEIKVLSTGGMVWLENNSDEGRPELRVKGNFRDPDWASDYSLCYNYKQGYSTVTMKVDDSLHSANAAFGLDTAFADNFRYNRRRHFFEGDYFMKQTNTWLGNPDTSNTVLTTYLKNNGSGMPVQSTDELGYTVTTILDTAGRTVKLINQDSTEILYSYATGTPASFGITGQDFYGVCSVKSTIDEAERVTKQYFDANGKLRRQVVDAGDSSWHRNLTTKYEYDVEGKLLTITNPESQVIRYWYDKFGRVIYKQQPDLGTISYGYDKTGKTRFQQTQRQADSGLVSFYEYDDLERLTVVGEARVQNTAGSVPAAVSGPDTLMLGRLTDYLNPDVLNDGGVGAGLTVNKTLWMLPMQPVPAVWSNMGAWTESCGGISPLFGSLFPAMDTVLRHAALKYPFPLRVPVAAGSFENLAVNPAHALTAIAYDTIPERLGTAWGAMPQYSTWAAISPHGSLRNLKGRKAAVAYRDHGGLPFHYTVYSYDERGRIEAMMRYTENLGFDAVYYTYNSANKVTSVTAADPLKKHTTWYSYDYNGRVDSVWTQLSSPGLGVSSPAYPFAQGQYNVAPARAAGRADIAYSYTQRQQIETMSYPPVATTIHYSYSQRKFPLEIRAERSPSGQPQDTVLRIGLSYAHSGLIATQTVWRSGQQEPTAFNYHYDRVNQLRRWDWYDKEILSAPHYRTMTEYSYDKVGNRTYMREKLYDTTSLYWLNHPYVYGTDGGPNHLNMVTDSMAMTKFMYDPDGAMNERLGMQQLSGSWNVHKERFGYSANGVLVSYMEGTVTGASDTVCWTETNVPLTTEWRYRYSPAGEREQKRLYTTGDSSYLWLPWNYYLLGGNGEHLAIYEGSEGSSLCDPVRNVSMKPLEYLSYGVGTSAIVIMNAKGAKEYRIGDHLGSVRVALAGTGSVIARYDYKPYGEQIVKYEDYTTKLPVKGYIDHEKDIESGMSNFGVRQYSDAAGRFFSIDPYWEKFADQSPYVYSYNNPLLFKDGSGRTAEVTCDGETITVSANFVFYGDVSEDDAKRLMENLKKAYANSDGSLTMQNKNGDQLPVKFNFTYEVLPFDVAGTRMTSASVKDNFIFVGNLPDENKEFGTRPDHAVTSGDRANIFCSPDLFNANIFEHEVGHLLGFPNENENDLYGRTIDFSKDQNAPDDLMVQWGNRRDNYNTVLTQDTVSYFSDQIHWYGDGSRGVINNTVRPNNSSK